MKLLKSIFVVFTIILYSCSAEDQLPTNGENSFFARLDGKKFVAEDITTFPSGTYYGLRAYVRNNSWELTITNTSRKIIYIYINSVNEPSSYFIKDGDSNVISPNPADTPTSAVLRNSSLDLLYVSSLKNEDEFIKITKIKGDSILIGKFEKITLIDPDNPNNKTILRDGKFNINLNTLNQLEQ
jgi:hypothetical protein